LATPPITQRPLNPGFDNTILVSWSIVPSAAFYKVYYDSDTTGAPYYGAGAAQGNSPIVVSNATNLTLTGLEQGKTYYITVTAVDAQGVQSYFSMENSCLFNPFTAIEIPQELPSEYYLLQNHPNPFNSSTTIRYAIPYSGMVAIKVYNVLGREVLTLVNEYKNPGIHSVNFNAANLVSGIYYYRLQAGDYVNTKKMILLR